MASKVSLQYPAGVRIRAGKANSASTRCHQGIGNAFGLEGSKRSLKKWRGFFLCWAQFDGDFAIMVAATNS